MKLAQAIFPEDAAKRIVLLSDGNQNLGNAVEQAQSLASAGVGVDVLPIHYRARAEIAVERVAIPPDVRRGEPFDVRVVVTNTAQATAKDSGEVPGRLILSRMAGGRTDVLSDQPVVLPPGKKVFTIRQKIGAAEFLHLRGPVRARSPRRRRHAAEQPRHGLHPHPRQGPGAVDRGSRASGRVRRAGRSAAAAGARGGSADEQPNLHHARRIAALRHGVAGQRAARAIQRRADCHARAKHATDGGGPGHARRAEQLRRRRLDRHRGRKGHARRFSDQERQGRSARRW